ncbi:MAG: hypothetical protein ACI8WB_005775 [Phenylobacterium sp.]
MCLIWNTQMMRWEIDFCDEFESEFLELDPKIRVAMASHIERFADWLTQQEDD